MIVLGLTGSIGMGKTTTANLFRDEGVPVFDADAVVHSLYAPDGRAVPLIRAVFPNAINEDNSVNRSRLGEHMRADPLNLAVLESFIHPWVQEAREDFLETARETDADIIVFDVPLLFEAGGDKRVDKTVVVTAPYEVQKMRVMARPGMTEALFETLLARQMPDAEKRARADVILFTDQGIETTRSDVQDLLKRLRSSYA